MNSRTANVAKAVTAQASVLTGWATSVPAAMRDGRFTRASGDLLVARLPRLPVGSRHFDDALGSVYICVSAIMVAHCVFRRRVQWRNEREAHGLLMMTMIAAAKLHARTYLFP
ncbi:hypothetical protein M4D79_06870 [Mycolicibacterium novocastrense]|nr:hypothetical protein M4D79_06870 [Mycolicibacterium novocastrense]